MKKKFVFLFSVFLFSLGTEASPLILSLNWKPEPEFGGFYTAQMTGIFKKSGLDIIIQPSGSGTPNVQMLAAEKVDLIVASGDEILIARERGSDIVALFSVYQTYPHAIMVHAERKFKNLGEVFSNEGLLAMQAGLPYVNFLNKKYPNAKVKIVPYTGGIGTFLHDPQYSQQCFVTSEPIAAENAGLKVQTFMVATEGYNPYVTVVAARKKWVDGHKELVTKLVSAVNAGWTEYLKNPTATNQLMNKLNPSMTVEVFDKTAEIQKKLIETDETKAHSLGYMSQTRWSELAKQLTQLGVLKNPSVADHVLGY